MKVSINLNLPIKAIALKPKEIGLPDEVFEVQDIHMGQSNTSVILVGFSGIYNSIDFKFFLGDKEIDIYGSGILNHYRTLTLPGIKYKGDLL